MSTQALAASPQVVAHDGSAKPNTAAALDALYRAHAPRVRFWARRLGGPHVDADDILHDVFLALFESIDSFERRASVSTWLYAITRNIVADRVTCLQRRQRLLGRHGLLLARDGSDSVDVDGRSSLRFIERAATQIPDNHRVAFFLTEIQGRSNAEAAAVMACNVTTVRVWRMRARTALANRLRWSAGAKAP